MAMYLPALPGVVPIDTSHVDFTAVVPADTVEGGVAGAQWTAPPGPEIAQVTVPEGGGGVDPDTVATKTSVAVPERGRLTLLPTTVIAGLGFGGGA